MNKQNEVSFQYFIEKFPEVELPVTLSEEALLSFSRHNDPLPQLMLQQYIMPFEEQPADEFTEYVACFRIPDTEGFHAIVYWRGALMDYQYVLMTFTPKGEPVDRHIIAGTFSDGGSLIRSVATIEEDWEILVVSGKMPAGRQNYDASSSTAQHLELLPDGKIVNI